MIDYSLIFLTNMVIITQYICLSNHPLYTLNLYMLHVNYILRVKLKSFNRATLCNFMDYTVHDILQATILECVAVSFSRGSSQPRDQTQVSHITHGFLTS